MANVLNIAETEGIDNLKVILGDAVDVLEKNNHFSCFDEVIIFSQIHGLKENIIKEDLFRKIF